MTIRNYIIFIFLSILLFYILFIQYNKTKFPFKTYYFPKITKDEFYNITSSNEPALFTNSLKYKIEFDDFCDKLGDKDIKTRYGDYGSTNGQNKRKFKNIKLKDICKNINSNTQYGANNIITLQEQLKSNIHLNNDNFNINRKGKLWIGPTQSSTPLHKDKPKNLSLQVYGNKKWLFYNKNDNKHLCFDDNNAKLEWSKYSINDYKTCPTARKAKLYEILMKPGYMLYLPKQWAHQVTNESNSIMINYWY